MVWSVVADFGKNNLIEPAGSRTQYAAPTGAETSTGQLEKHSGQSNADRQRVALHWPNSNAIMKTVSHSLPFTSSLFPGQQVAQTRGSLGQS